jgi:hypothetical protein
LSAEGRVNDLRAVERRLAWLHAQQSRLLAVMAEAGQASPAWEQGLVVEEVACALRLSSRTGAGRLADAQLLAARSATSQLQEQGLISPLHSRAVTDAVLGLDEPVAAKVESRVLQRAPQQALSNFTASLKRAVLVLAPRKTVEEAQYEAMQDRRVVVTPLDDGMAQLWALLPAGGAAAVITAVNALADRVQPDDPRCVEQRRADALVQMGIDVLTGQTSGGLPTRQRMKPAVQVTVALSTLLGLDHQPAELDPAELDGHGPIAASVARRIAADESGTWRRLLTDEQGRLLDYGRTIYRPPTDDDTGWTVQPSTAAS